MPMRYWVSAACAAGLAITGCATAGTAPTKTNHQINVPTTGKQMVRVAVAFDPQIVAKGGRHIVTPVGDLNGKYRLVLDSYASKPQGLSRCQAGQERWARLIDMTARREIYHRLIESCLRDVGSSDPPARWDADGQGFTLDLLSADPIHVSLLSNGTAKEQ